MNKHEKALEAAKILRNYCESFNANCEGCVFSSPDPEVAYWNECILNCRLPERWRIKEEEDE